jgi:hypothetical protein
MSWNSYYAAYLGQEVRDHRGRGERPRVPPQQPLSPRVPPRDPRVPPPGQPIGPRVPPRDPRPPRPVQPQEPDPRVTTRPEDLRPRDDDRDRDRRRHHRHRRYRDQYDLPWGQRYYGDYIFLVGYGWLPRWYPYWDPQWYDYWWFLFDYYGGDAAADYAAYARDMVLRGYARQYGWL